jgi:hypothetical protein
MRSSVVEEFKSSGVESNMADFVLVSKSMNETVKLAAIFRACEQTEVKGILVVIEVDHALSPLSTESKLIDLQGFSSGGTVNVQERRYVGNVVELLC